MLHKSIPLGDNHGLANWSCASSAARLALSLVAADEGKVAYQASDKTYWLLASYSPATWLPLGGSLVRTAYINNLALKLSIARNKHIHNLMLYTT